MYKTIQQIGIQDGNKLPSGISPPIIARNGAKSALSNSLVQGKRKINEAKQRCGIPVDHGYDGMWNFNNTSTGFTWSSKEGEDGTDN